MAVGVAVGIGVAVGVAVCVGVAVYVGVEDGAVVGVQVGMGLGVGEWVGVYVAVGSMATGIGVGVLSIAPKAQRPVRQVTTRQTTSKLAAPAIRALWPAVSLGGSTRCIKACRDASAAAKAEASPS